MSKRFRLQPRSLPMAIRDCGVDGQVDISPFSTRGWHVEHVQEGLQRQPNVYFREIDAKNVLLQLSYVPSKSNPADWFSRVLSKADLMLSKQCWGLVESQFGGASGHNLDLMALDSNVQRGRQGAPLRHFTLYPTPGSGGVNAFNQNLSICDRTKVNAYVFSLFALISAVLQFLSSQKVVVTTIVPCLSPFPS